MKIQWTESVPEKEGRYWFYGDPFWGGMNRKPSLSTFEVRLVIVDVRKISNGYMYVIDGAFMFQGHGVWSTLSIEEPDNLPEDLQLPTKNG